jgi:hypothetical protein
VKDNAVKFAFCFGMKFVDVVGNRVKNSLCEDVFCPTASEPLETVILLENTESPFGLNTTVKAQKFTCIGGYAISGFLTKSNKIL